MIKLINRLAYIISLALGVSLSHVFYNEFWSYGYHSDSFFSIIILGFIFGMIIKKMFLSKNFVISTIVEYTNKVVLKAKTGEIININKNVSISSEENIITKNQDAVQDENVECIDEAYEKIEEISYEKALQMRLK